jgi:uncharacterized membrane protein
MARPLAGSRRLDRNINAILKRRQEAEFEKTLQDKIADKITHFAGSMIFIYFHLAACGFWIAANMGWLPGVPMFDPSFVILAMIASVEAIFISTFVLISQNRMAEDDDKRADLNLQISLLAEQEATQLLTLVSAIAARLDVKTAVDAEVGELATEVTPEDVLDRLEKRKADADD